MNLPRLIPFTQDALPALEAAARSDNHRVVLPTHLVMKGEGIVGYFSIAAAPLNFLWVHSQNLAARESFGLFNAAENFLRLTGARHALTTGSPNSPLRPYVTALGYEHLSTVDIFLKRL